MAEAPVFRFAPSPNGYLHLGHALSALTNADAANHCNGMLLLRIEDIDPGRCRPHFEAAIRADLAWLGLAFEEPVRRQSEHLAFYAEALADLARRDLVYPCFCSRNQIAQAAAARERETGIPWPRDPDGTPLYPGTCRALPRQIAQRRACSEVHVLRLDSAKALSGFRHLAFREHATPLPSSASTLTESDASAWGDVALGRKDIPASYHLAVVLDDALQGVTMVVRGADLERATGVHRLLQHLLGLPTPGYHHHRLILGEDGRKLSKSTASTALRELRATGLIPADIRRRVGLGG